MSVQMAGWLGALGRTGLLGRQAGDGLDGAAAVVGADRLAELQRWLAAQPPSVVDRERVAAIEACFWMAHADRSVAPEERFLLRQLMARAGIEPDDVDALVDHAHEAPSLIGLEQRVTHPVLRELLLALAAGLAHADGHLAPEELASYGELALRLGVSSERADAVWSAVASSS